MSTVTETSDAQLVALLRSRGAMGIAELAAGMSVTATAVRQRLTRLMAQGLIERGLAQRGLSHDGNAALGSEAEGTKVSRGRPSHVYSLTEKARRQASSNFADLAIVLWDEIRAVKDLEVRRGLLQRMAGAMARMYAEQIEGVTAGQRMESLKKLFAERGVPFKVEPPSVAGSLPVLTAVECPYPELAERDRGICALERMLFSELLQSPVRLSQCRLEGHDCCQFESN